MMEEHDKIKLLYEQSIEWHKYYANWRYRLFAGYIVIVSSIGFFIFTWIQKPENFSNLTYELACWSGIFITIIFIFINFRITRLIWYCQNTAYLNEKQLGLSKDTLGIYGRLVSKGVRDRLDRSANVQKLSSADIINLLKPWYHSGAHNWFFIIVIIAFSVLLFKTCELEVKRIEWQNKNLHEQLSK